MKKILMLFMGLISLAGAAHSAISPIPSGEGVFWPATKAGIDSNFSELNSRLQAVETSGPDLQWAIGISYTLGNTGVIHGGKLYTCKEAHLSSSLTEPGVGVNWLLAWNDPTVTIPTAASLSVDDIISLSGVAEGAVNLGIFTGTTISDNLTIKASLQTLETAIEGIEVGGLASLDDLPGDTVNDSHIDFALLAGVAASLGVDDNYVTDLEKTSIGTIGDKLDAGTVITVSPAVETLLGSADAAAIKTNIGMVAADVSTLFTGTGYLNTDGTASVPSNTFTGTAADIPILDTGEYLLATNVEDALPEIVNMASDGVNLIFGSGLVVTETGTGEETVTAVFTGVAADIPILDTGEYLLSTNVEDALPEIVNMANDGVNLIFGSGLLVTNTGTGEETVSVDLPYTGPVTSYKTAAYTIGTDDPSECYGGTIHVTGAAIITACDNLAEKMNFTVVTRVAVAASLKAQADNHLTLAGVGTLDPGDKATNRATIDDIIYCEYESVDGLYCMSYSNSGAGNKWTDGGQ